MFSKIYLKESLKNALCSLTKIRYAFSRNLTIKAGYVFNSHLTVSAQSFFYLNGFSIRNSNIVINGNNNELICNGKIYNLEILIEGTDNSIIIENAKEWVKNTRITIRGNNCRVKIGKNSSINESNIVCMGLNTQIHIGDECMFAEQIEIWNTDSHPIFDRDNQDTPINKSKSIYIGNHVWLGSRSVVLKGVHIGENSIVGLGSIVTKDIPKNVVAVGNPCRIVRENVTWNRNHINL